MSSNAVTMAAWTRSHEARRRAAEKHLRARDRDWSATWERARRSPGLEATRSRDLAHLGGFAALLALVGYLTWRISATLPASGPGRIAGWLLIGLEAVALVPTTWRLATHWDVDAVSPAPVKRVPLGMTAAIVVPTYDEAAEVLAPTVAAACALKPAHETWVLDDGHRPWVADMCAAYGARYVSRAIRHQERSGSLNHALTLMQRETAGGPVDDVDLIAVVEAGDVPLPTLLTATLGWFADPEVASVEVRATHGSDAWDDAAPGRPGRASSALFRTRALREVGGIATDGDPRSTFLGLEQAGWRTEHHDQAVVIDRASTSPASYVAAVQRRGVAAVQQLVGGARRTEPADGRFSRLAAAANALQGAGILLALLVAATLLVSGADISTADPMAFSFVLASTLAVRAWGTRRISRVTLDQGDLLARWTVQVCAGVSCARWLLTGKARSTGVEATLRTVAVVETVLVALLGYAVAGLAGVAPWRTSASSTVASGAWLLVAAAALGIGAFRLRSADVAARRTDLRRFRIDGRATVDGFDVDLLDLGTDGATVRLPLHDWPGAGTVQLTLPGVETVTLALLPETGASGQRALRALPGDWQALRTLSLWLFHMHPGTRPGTRPRTQPGAAGHAGSTTPTQLKTVMHP